MPAEKLKTRSIELDIRIDAPVENIWNALSDPDQLANWFPLTAHGTKGKGGQISLSWGSPEEWTTIIDIWEPNKHLRLVDPPAAEGIPPTAIDFRLETVGGTTIVRLVNSGFSADADWDEMLDTMTSGWTYFLFNLQQYVERHFDTPREMVWVRRRTTKSPSDIWDDVLGPNGLAIEGYASSVEPQSPYACSSLSEPITGKVQMINPPVHFVGTADTLDDGVLFVEVEPGKDSRHVGIWLSTYGLTSKRVRSLQDALNTVADRIFGREEPKS